MSGSPHGESDHAKTSMGIIISVQKVSEAYQRMVRVPYAFRIEQHVRAVFTTLRGCPDKSPLSPGGVADFGFVFRLAMLAAGDDEGEATWCPCKNSY
jgi:hypothetical protein